MTQPSIALALLLTAVAAYFLGRRLASPREKRCSFCHKGEDAVRKLISSPDDRPRAYICNECVAVCSKILQADSSDGPGSSQT